MPSVDVVVPNYQYGRYLRDCVASILNQGIDQLRVLIVDNASTDDSVEVAQELADCSSQIEVRLHATNLGFHASVNEGLDWAASDYLIVLCADDLLPPGALRRAVSIMEENPGTAFAYGAYARMTGSITSAPLEETPQAAWRIENGDRFIARCCQDMVHAMAPLVRTSIQKKIGYYRSELRQTSDLEMLLRLACGGDPLTPSHLVPCSVSCFNGRLVIVNGFAVCVCLSPLSMCVSHYYLFKCIINNAAPPKKRCIMK